MHQQNKGVITKKNGAYQKLKTTTAKSWTNQSLTTGKAYYYKMRSYKVVKGKKAYSAYSSVKSKKTR